MGYPNAAPGGNAQGLRMYNKGASDACLLFHDDQYRGLKWNLNSKGTAEGEDKTYHEPSPDYLKLLYRGGEGLEPVGYGYRSIEACVKSALRVEAAGNPAARHKMIQAIDREGIIATPANSAYNELVIEYGDNPHVHFKEYQK